MDQTPNNLAAYCWSIADLLRGDFKQSQYGRIILPFTLLRRLECVLQDSKDKVLAEFERLQTTNLPEEAHEKFLLRASGISFYNTSQMDLSKLGQADIKDNLENYIQSFSTDAREIFEYFNFAEFIGQLNDADLLFEIVKKVKATDLSPKAISNHDMGLVFEELIRRFAESSNETAGEHFTPRDIVRLTTSLVFMEDDDALTKEGIIRTIYDPTAGTGGFLSSGMEYVHELNPQAVIKAFGQELNPESYAICKADMLIKGQEVDNIKLGNTLSNDQLYADKFDYMLSNPPFGVDWKKIVDKIKDEHEEKGFDGRFGPGLPRVFDGSLLFLLHLISKLREASEGGGRIGIILNGSPLFTGGAGSGESEIRRYILEADLLETIVALPTDMFYNTGIATYVWVLSNKKATERKGKVQLINGVNLCDKMRKSLGSKRNEMSEDDITKIINAAYTYENSDVSKVFSNHEFGYRRISIERPLRESYQFSDERIAELRFAAKSLCAPMRWIYETYGSNWFDDEDCKRYGQLDEHEKDIRTHLKAHFRDLKESKIKELLNIKTWKHQKQTLLKAQILQAEIGNAQCNDMNTYEENIKAACKSKEFTLSATEKRQIASAVSWSNPNAKKVIKKIHKNTKANPLYGLFDVGGKTIEYKADVNLRDYENVRLNQTRNANESNEAYFKKEVLPYASDAWIDSSLKDDKDHEVGVVGYEINFKKLISEKYGVHEDRGQGEVIKIKNIFTVHQDGIFEISLYDLSIREVDSASPSNSPYYPKIKVNRKKLNVNYFNIFIKSQEGVDWLDSVGTGAVSHHIPLRMLMDAKISLPSITEQNQIIDLNEKYLGVLEELRVMNPALVSDHTEFERLLEPYLDATERYQNEFQHKLPYPLATLWIQAKSSLSQKEECESLCKFYEYLGLYLIAIIFGFMEPEKVLNELQEKNGKRKGMPKALTMGYSHNIIRNFSENHFDNFPEGMKNIFSKDLIEILQKATEIRNDISHRGLTSGDEISRKYRELQKLNDRLQSQLKDFFSTYTLFSPLNARYDGEKYMYQIEHLNGLALNPSLKEIIYSELPLIDGRLYLAHIQPGKEATKSYLLHQIVSLDEVDNDPGFKAFYFYSDFIDEGYEEGRYKYQLRFVCPYPNMKMHKLKELKEVGLKS